MKRFRKVLFICALISFVFFAIGCDSILNPNKGTKSSYIFEWNCTYANYIDVYPSNGGSPSYFRLTRSNRSVKVTWEDEGNDYFGGFRCTYNYPSGRNSPHYSCYHSLKQVSFYDY